MGRKEDFLSCSLNKHHFIALVAEKLTECGVNAVHSERDADVDIVKASIAMSQNFSTTLIGEDTDLLILLLYFAYMASLFLCDSTRQGKR